MDRLKTRLEVFMNVNTFGAAVDVTVTLVVAWDHSDLVGGGCLDAVVMGGCWVAVGLAPVMGDISMFIFIGTPVYSNVYTYMNI